MIDASALAEHAAMRAAVETLLYDLQDDIQDVVTRLESYVADGQSEMVAALQPSIQAVYEFASVNLPEDGNDGPFDWSPLYRMQDAVRSELFTLETDVAVVGSRAIDNARAQINSLLPSTSEVFGGVVAVFGRLIDGLLESLSDSGDFWSALLSSIEEKYPDKVLAFGNFAAETTRILSNLMAAELNMRVGRTREQLVEAATSGGDRPIDPASLQQAISSLPTWAQDMIGLALAAASGFSYAGATNAGPLAATHQASLARYVPTALGAGDLAELVRRKLVGMDWARTHARRSGLSSELFDLIYGLSERKLSTDQILDLYRRSGSEAVLDELYALGFSQESVAALKTLSLAEATPADVVRFLARDVTDPAAVAAGNLDKDFSAKYDKRLFDKAGVSEELARYYWRAHWQFPSPTQGYSMLHRKEITMPQLRQMLELADYAPAYIDALINVAYLTPGRIDVRRMFEVGIIPSRNDLLPYYEAMGYEPSMAAIMADFTVKLKGISDESKADRRFGRIATEIVRAFVVGIMSEMQAKEALGQLGFSDERAALRLAEGEYSRQRERADTIRDTIGRRYVGGYITEERARELLNGYAFDKTEANYLLDGWNIQRELRDETDAEKLQKDLSKSELLAGYRDGLLDRQSTHDALTALGYDGNESDLLIKLEDAKEARSDAKSIEQSARTQYIRRRIDSASARDILEGLAYTPTKVAALLSRWTVEREEAVPDISTAQIERMLMQGIIPEEQVEERLRQRGYTEQDIAALMTLYGTDMSIAEEKMKAQQEQFRIREERLRLQGDRRLDLTERGQDLGMDRFSVSQDAAQRRFESAQEQTARLQTERLATTRSLQTERIASQTARDAAQAVAARERQEASAAASLERLALQIEAAGQRQQAALNAAAEARAQQAEYRRQQAESRDASEQRRLAAQADRQNRSIEAAERRAQEAGRLRESLQANAQAFDLELTELRSQLQALRDVRQEAARIQSEVRGEARAVRAETRQAARRDITAADAAAQASRLQSVQLQQSAALAEVNARFSGLLAQVADTRRQEALASRQAAERALSNATPVTTLLDTVL